MLEGGQKMKRVYLAGPFFNEGAHANISLDELKDYDFEQLSSSFYSGEMR
jgi:nucleoside 2-deoxyribosyltransferase